MITNPEIIAALKALAEKNNGCLQPEVVVNAARSERSPLHHCFEWDDTEAAHNWRLHQARNLIRVTVEYADRTPANVFVSLTPDRAAGTGYRVLATVMSDADQRRQLLTDAAAEMETFRKKYARLRELVEVFKAMRAAARKIKRAA